MKKTYIGSILLFLALIPMLLHTDYVTEGARYGLLLWYHSVVPALFPFMVLSGLLVAQGGVHVIMEPFYRILCPILPVSRDGCYVLVAGFLCGYPMGAKTCADFVRSGRISLEEGNFLMAICNHPSPMFLLGYVYPFFSDLLPVWMLLLCVYAPVVLLAPISSSFYFQKNEFNITENDPQARWLKRTDYFYNPKQTVSADESILSAVTILCKIGGYLVLFSIMIVFLRHAEWIPFLLRLLLIGALEMTTGIRELSSSLSTVPAFAASVAALTFGGLSGIFQTKSVLSTAADPDISMGLNDFKKGQKKAGLSIRPYIFWKLLHAALAAGIAEILCIFLNITG